MRENGKMGEFARLLSRRPDAIAWMRGDEAHRDICGTVRFYQASCGTLMAVDISGLPEHTMRGDCPVFGFHIHAGEKCSGNETDHFADAGAHYDSDDHEHPCHRGDLPPLMASRGRANLMFFTERFCVREVLGRTVIIHGNPDDFTSQPAGDAGMKIACGEIKAVCC